MRRSKMSAQEALANLARLAEENAKTINDKSLHSHYLSHVREMRAIVGTELLRLQAQRDYYRDRKGEE